MLSPIKLNIADKLEKNKKFRERFFRGQAQDRIAMNIRELRKKRKKLQVDLAKETNMKQSAVSRIEQADYSGLSFSTLFRVADALEARLLVSFEPVEDVIDWYRRKEAEITAEPTLFADIQKGESMKNICIKCGKPIGNITFTACDNCWDKKQLLEELLDNTIECYNMEASFYYRRHGRSEHAQAKHKNILKKYEDRIKEVRKILGYETYPDKTTETYIQQEGK